MRGAERVAIIDNIEYRLQFAKDRMPNIETINFDKVKVRMPAPAFEKHPLFSLVTKEVV